MMNTMREVQTRLVLDWLRRRGTITQLEAKDELGILRLAARIFDIKNGNGCEPAQIDTRMVEVCNRDGETCRVAEYRLAEWVPVAVPRQPEFTGTPMLFDY